MCVPSNGKDTFRRDIRKMQKQLLDHQRRANIDLMNKNNAGRGK
jgi:hypothetical protein